MNIVVVGAGKLGQTIADALTREEHNVTVMDNDEVLLKQIGDNMDVMTHMGNGANGNMLLEAGVSGADIVIATTAVDETNMLCCLLSKRLGAKFTIARVRNPEYSESLFMLQQELGIDLTVNPERATAMEISRLLRFPFAGSIDSFARSRVEMVQFLVQEKDKIVGIPMKDIAAKLNAPRVLYAIVERDGIVHIPRGEFKIEVGDRLFVAADVATINGFFKFLGKTTHRLKNVLILGGGRISYYLTRIISSSGMTSTIIELNAEKARRLSEELNDDKKNISVSVIEGDGTDQELLTEQLANKDAFIALGNRDEENLMTGLYALKRGVPKVIVKNNRVAFTDVINELGLESIVVPRAITCANILRNVRARMSSEGTKIEKLYRLLDGRVEALEFIARAEDSYIGIPIKELQIRPNSLIAVIVRKGRVIVPFGSDHIEPNDMVIVIVCGTGLTDLNKIIARK